MQFKQAIGTGVGGDLTGSVVTVVRAADRLIAPSAIQRIDQARNGSRMPIDQIPADANGCANKLAQTVQCVGPPHIGVVPQVAQLFYEIKYPSDDIPRDSLGSRHQHPTSFRDCTCSCSGIKSFSESFHSEVRSPTAMDAFTTSLRHFTKGRREDNG